MTRCIGIDPAPGKPTVVCEQLADGTFAFTPWQPYEVRARIVELLDNAAASGQKLVVTWDAPLRLDPGAVPGSRDYASRLIDNAVSRWKRGVPLEAGAVGVANASSVPHNLLTQHVWGLPVGAAPAHGAHLLLPGQMHATVSASCVLAEVHPAVALAAWWVGQGASGPMPKYKDERKNARSGLRKVAEFVRDHVDATCPIDDILTEKDAVLSDVAGLPDDRLDAWIAWKLAHDWTNGAAHPVGPPDGGSYLLPTSLDWRVLHDGLSDSAKQKLKKRSAAAC